MNIIEAETLDEAGAGASRIVTHIKNGVPFFMISACRATLSPTENKKRTDVLRKQLASLPGVSFVETSGEYQEDGQEAPTKEDSFYVLPRSKNSNLNGFKSIGVKLMKALDQDSILLGDGENILLKFADGNEETIGSAATFDPAVIKQLPGNSSIKGKKFGISTPDDAPKAVKYGASRAA